MSKLAGEASANNIEIYEPVTCYAETNESVTLQSEGKQTFKLLFLQDRKHTRRIVKPI